MPWSLALLLACSAEDAGSLDDNDAGSSSTPDSTLVLPEAGIPFDDAALAADADVDLDAGDTGSAMCRVVADCGRIIGRPPVCPDGIPGRWACTQNLCVLDCGGMGAPCQTDCDCPFTESCILGRCGVADRRNFCCDNPDCPLGAICIESTGQPSQCPETPDAGTSLDAGPAPVVPVGAACMSPADCNGGLCVDPASGFPGGYCTQACSRGGCPTGAACVDFGPGGAFCLDDCAVNADCRAAYQCVRVGTSTTTVCFPEPPSSNNPNGDPVGSACVSDNDCLQGLNCLVQPGWTGGYCTKLFCDAVNNPCPTGSYCYNFPGQSLCLDDCTVGATPSECRAPYYCFGPAGGTGGCLPR